MKKILLVLMGSFCAVFAADSFKLTEKVTDKLVTTDGFPEPQRTISGSINATVTIPGLGALQIDQFTMWSLRIGEFEIGSMLGDATRTTANSATFTQYDMEEHQVGSITFTRSGDKLTITATSSSLPEGGVISSHLMGEAGTEYGSVDVQIMIDDLMWNRPVFYKAVTTITHRTQSEMEFDLYSINITAELDTAKPTVSITSPKANERVMADQVIISGKAADNYGLDHVLIYVNDDAAGPAELENGLWTFATELAAGPNTIAAKAVDLAGNESTVASVKVTKVVSAQLTLEIDLGGTVKGSTNGAFLEVGKRYTLTATAESGFIFTGWRVGDTIVGTNATYNLVMVEGGLTLHASFDPSVFNGLFMPIATEDHPNVPTVTATNSGFITLTRTAAGVLSGKILMQGKTFSFSGKKITNDSANFQVTRAGATALTVQFSLEKDFDNGATHIFGTVGDTNFTSTMNADSGAGANSPFNGKYTSGIIAVAVEGATVPFGSGPCAFNITKGNAAFSGSLSDGAGITTSAPLVITSDGRAGLPFYNPTQAGKGVAIGWILLANFGEGASAGIDVTASNGHWAKAPASTDKLYRPGFNTEFNVFGGNYTPFAATANPFGWTDGWLSLYEGNLPTSAGGPTVSKTVVVNKGKITLTDLPEEPTGTPKATSLKLTVTITPATGLVTGSFKNPGTGAVSPINGILLQGESFGTINGYFLGTNRSGGIVISGGQN